MSETVAADRASEERPITFVAEEQQLVGILHAPPVLATRAIVVVVGGPQYRVGSHRQFVYLARFLATQGYPVLRFDYRGMGDSEGAPQIFYDTRIDIKAAIDVLQQQLPSVKKVVLWALCDGASGSLIYAPTDPRVDGLVLLNPWVRTEANIARTYVRNYYWSRLAEREFWKKLLSGQLNVLQSAQQLVNHLAAAFKSSARVEDEPAFSDYVARMEWAMQRFTGESLIVLSGNDLTGQEFKLWVDADASRVKRFRRASTRWFEVPEANHTFSSAAWRAAVERATLEWVASLPKP